MKRLLSVALTLILLVGAIFAVTSCGECDHSFSFSTAYESWPTCTQPGYGFEVSYCDKCGIQDPDFVGERFEIPVDPEFHMWGPPELEQYEDCPGLVIWAIRCEDCGVLQSYTSSPELDYEFECPPHNDYNEDGFCDFCYEQMQRLNCPGHESNDGDEYCDWCDTYIPPRISVTSIALNADSCRLNIGESFSFIYSYYPTDAEDTEIVWSTTTPDIISVENGVVTAIGDGIGEVVATLASNSSVTATAKVYSGSFEVTFEYAPTTIYDRYQGYKIIGVYSEYYPETLVVPSTYNGEPVVLVSNVSLDRLTGVKKIVFSEGIKQINHAAITNCEDLETVVIPDSILACGSYFFENCPSLQFNTDAMGKYLGNEDNPYLVLVKGAEGLTSYVANENTRIICRDAFRDNTSLTFASLGSVVYIGMEAFYNTGLVGIILPDTVQTVVGDAFRECSALKSITVGKGIVEMGIGAFMYCPSVEYVYFNVPNMHDVGEANPVFGSMEAVTNPSATLTFVIGPDVERVPNRLFERAYGHSNAVIDLSGASSLTEIGEYAFAGVGFANLELTIPDSVTVIGEGAFSANSGLKTVYIGHRLVTLGEDAFADCGNIENIFFENATLSGAEIRAALPTGWGAETLTVTIGSGISSVPDAFLRDVFTLYNYGFSVEIEFEEGGTYSIGESAFEGAPIKTLDLSRVQVIGKGAFKNCELLSELNLSGYVSTVGDYAFWGTGISSLSFNSFVSSLGKYAFGECENLATVSFIGHQIVGLPEGVFYGCTSLNTVEIPSTVIAIGKLAFAHSGLTSINIPASVTVFAERPFEGCENLETVTLPANMTEIPANFLVDCSGFNNSSILEGITKIGDYAFWGTGIEVLTIPNSVTEIGTGAFGNCEKLSVINHNAKSLKSILASGIFENSGTETDGITVNVGKEITYISENLFNTVNGVNITEIVFAEDGALAKIYDYAFAKLTGVTELDIPETVDFIDRYAFLDMTGLKTLRLHLIAGFSSTESTFKNTGNIEEGFEIILGNKTSRYLPTLFKLSNVTSLVFEDGALLESIPNIAFSDMGKTLRSITLHEGLVSINMSAFFGCEHITEITIPSTVTEIKAISYFYASADRCDPKLVNINIHEDNESFVFEDGVLYNADKTVLVWYPSARADTKFVIPDSVTEIAVGAFMYARELREVVIPEHITVIPDYAFAVCNGLTAINTEHLTEIGAHAFDYTDFENLTVTAPAVVNEDEE